MGRPGFLRLEGGGIQALCYAEVQALTNKELKETLLKLVKCDKARKSTEASIESSER